MVIKLDFTEGYTYVTNIYADWPVNMKVNVTNDNKENKYNLSINSITMYHVTFKLTQAQLQISCT